MDLSHKPHVLYLASIERMHAARRCIDQKPLDYVLAAYLAGLAVECILHAIAFRDGATHDAWHGLSSWLAKCPPSLHDAIKPAAVEDWNRVLVLWDNRLRYLSVDGFIGYLRDRGFTRGLKGDRDSLMRRNVKLLVDAAERVHQKGLAQWHRSTKK